MLARWRQNSSNAIGTNAQAVRDVAEEVEAAEREQHGAVSAASDEILKPKAIVAQITSNASPSGQCRANAMPGGRRHAFAAAKRWNTGNRWPTKTASAATGTTQSGNPK